MVDIPVPTEQYEAQNGYINWKVNGKWQAASRAIMEAILERELLPGE